MLAALELQKDAELGQAPCKDFSTVLSPDRFPLGLRGLNNLGNTCFMNCILQIFVHAPLVRNFFLGEGHNPACCKHQSRGGKPCLGCEMDTLFGRMYSGERQPYSPADLLYSWWSFADDLAGYRQQDAHEFYLSLLSALSDIHIRPAAIPNGGTATAAAAAGSGQEEEAGEQQQQQQQGGFVGTPSATPPHSHSAYPSPLPSPLHRGLSPSLEHTPPLTSHAPSPGAGPFGSGLDLHLSRQPSDSGTSWLDDAADWDASLAARPTSASPEITSVRKKPAGPWASAVSPLLPPGRNSVMTTPNGVRSASPYPTEPEASFPSMLSSIPPGSPLPGPSTAAGSDPAAASGSAGPSGMAVGTEGLVEGVFGGLLRSDVTCLVCGHTSTAFDPFLDISLDLISQDGKPLSGTAAAAAHHTFPAAAARVKRSIQSGASLRCPGSKPHNSGKAPAWGRGAHRTSDSDADEDASVSEESPVRVGTGRGRGRGRAAVGAGAGQKMKRQNVRLPRGGKAGRGAGKHGAGDTSNHASFGSGVAQHGVAGSVLPPSTTTSAGGGSGASGSVGLQGDSMDVDAAAALQQQQRRHRAAAGYGSDADGDGALSGIPAASVTPECSECFSFPASADLHQTAQGPARGGYACGDAKARGGKGRAAAILASGGGGSSRGNRSERAVVAPSLPGADDNSCSWRSPLAVSAAAGRQQGAAPVLGPPVGGDNSGGNGRWQHQQLVPVDPISDSMQLRPAALTNSHQQGQQQGSEDDVQMIDISSMLGRHSDLGGSLPQHQQQPRQPASLQQQQQQQHDWGQQQHQQQQSGDTPSNRLHTSNPGARQLYGQQQQQHAAKPAAMVTTFPAASAAPASRQLSAHVTAPAAAGAKMGTPGYLPAAASPGQGQRHLDLGGPASSFPTQGQGSRTLQRQQTQPAAAAAAAAAGPATSPPSAPGPWPTHLSQLPPAAYNEQHPNSYPMASQASQSPVPNQLPSIQQQAAWPPAAYMAWLQHAQAAAAVAWGWGWPGQAQGKQAPGQAAAQQPQQQQQQGLASPDRQQQHQVVLSPTQRQQQQGMHSPSQQQEQSNGMLQWPCQQHHGAGLQSNQHAWPQQQQQQQVPVHSVPGGTPWQQAPGRPMPASGSTATPDVTAHVAAVPPVTGDGGGTALGHNDGVHGVAIKGLAAAGAAAEGTGKVSKKASAKAGVASQQSLPLSPHDVQAAGSPSQAQRKSVRCGECNTCRNKHLKKGCLRNREAVRERKEQQGEQQAAAHAGAAAAAAAAGSVTAKAAGPAAAAAVITEVWKQEAVSADAMLGFGARVAAKSPKPDQGTMPPPQQQQQHQQQETGQSSVSRLFNRRQLAGRSPPGKPSHPLPPGSVSKGEQPPCRLPGGGISLPQQQQQSRQHGHGSVSEAGKVACLSEQPPLPPGSICKGRQLPCRLPGGGMSPPQQQQKQAWQLEQGSTFEAGEGACLRGRPPLPPTHRNQTLGCVMQRALQDSGAASASKSQLPPLPPAILSDGGTGGTLTQQQQWQQWQQQQQQQRAVNGGAPVKYSSGPQQAQLPGSFPCTDLEPTRAALVNTAVEQHHGLPSAPVTSSSDIPSLSRSLAHFVQPERLPPGESWVCSHCRRQQAAVKQLSIRRLPPLLALHVKRFEHGGPSGHLWGATKGASAAGTRKLQAPLTFPTGQLDMAPFTSAAILRERYKCRGPIKPPSPETEELVRMMQEAQAVAPAAAAACDASGPAEAPLPDEAKAAGTMFGSCGNDGTCAYVHGMPATECLTQGSGPGPPAQPVREAAAAAAAAAGTSSGLPEPERGGRGKTEAEDAAGQAQQGGTVGDVGDDDPTATAAAAVMPSCLFSLLGAVCHKGDITGGHYISYIKCGSLWYCCDDAWINLVDEAVVAGCQAYMLFYLRSDCMDAEGCGMQHLGQQQQQLLGQ